MKDQWGGGILESRKNPKVLQRFNKNKKQKQILVGSIIGILLIVGGISLYRSFAMYKVEKTFNVLEGIVPDFSNEGDIILGYTINDVPQSGNFPDKESGLYGKVSKCENNTVAVWDNDSWGLTNIVPGENKKVICTIAFKQLFSSYLIKLAQENIDVTKSGLLSQSHEQTIQTAENAIIDYRYVGPNPNNFVCLEENGDCSNEDKLYRIVGVIPIQKDVNGTYELRVKLEKYIAYVGASAIETSLTLSGKGYYWSGTTSNQSNNWLNTSLNTQILNNEYWNSIQSYHNYIEDAKWYLGGINNQGSFTKIYNEERGNTGGGNAPNILYTITKIGLVHASDYGYSTSGGSEHNRQECLSVDTYTTSTSNNLWGYSGSQDPIYHGECAENSWLYIAGEVQNLLALTRTLSGAMNLGGNGGVWPMAVYLSPNVYAAHPSFYLKKEVLYKSGNGSKENPYLISINNS